MSLRIFVALCIAFLGGWTYAHFIVADECEKLGSFYVGDQVFKCLALERK